MVATRLRTIEDLEAMPDVVGTQARNHARRRDQGCHHGTITIGQILATSCFQEQDRVARPGGMAPPRAQWPVCRSPLRNSRRCVRKRVFMALWQRLSTR